MRFLAVIGKNMHNDKIGKEDRHGWLSNLWSLFGTLDDRCRTIIGTRKGTLILPTTHMEDGTWCPPSANGYHCYLLNVGHWQPILENPDSERRMELFVQGPT